MDKTTLISAIGAAEKKQPTLVIKNARVINVFTNEIIEGDIGIYNDIIIGTGNFECENTIDACGRYACPGFVDAHVHIESSFATPSVFAQAVLPHGTTSAVCDPHEIANVLGARGVRYMLRASEKIGLHVFFMMPSCVPCTDFESNGSPFTPYDMQEFKANPRVLGLAEVMDVPAVMRGREDMMEKLLMFSDEKIDGHAPLVSGSTLNAYCVAGASTDHECSNFEEVREKLRAGMNIHMRVGSAASYIDDLLSGLAQSGLPTDNVLFCTDDKSLGDIVKYGHINCIVRRAVELGIPAADAIRMATINAARAYHIPRIGAIAPGYTADILLLDDLNSFDPVRVIAGGRPIEEIDFPHEDGHGENSVHLAPLPENAFWFKKHEHMPAAELIKGKLITKLVYTDTTDGFNKAAVIERHKATGNIGIGLVRGFGIKNGAIASTVAHDSHNLVVVGDNDADMRTAALVLEHAGGGYAVVSDGEVLSLLPLPIAGLMTDAPLGQILSEQRHLHEATHKIGVPEDVEPFENLSFLALPVIPAVRITDLGMFDSVNFRFFDR